MYYYYYYIYKFVNRR